MPLTIKKIQSSKVDALLTVPNDVESNKDTILRLNSYITKNDLYKTNTLLLKCEFCIAINNHSILPRALRYIAIS